MVARYDEGSGRQRKLGEKYQNEPLMLGLRSQLCDVPKRPWRVSPSVRSSLYLDLDCRSIGKKRSDAQDVRSRESIARQSGSPAMPDRSRTPRQPRYYRPVSPLPPLAEDALHCRIACVGDNLVMRRLTSLFSIGKSSPDYLPSACSNSEAARSPSTRCQPRRVQPQPTRLNHPVMRP